MRAPLHIDAYAYAVKSINPYSFITSPKKFIQRSATSIGMDISSNINPDPDTTDAGSKAEDVEPGVTKVGEPGNIWISWTPGSESVTGSSRSYHRKTRTGCIRCRTRRVKVGGSFRSRCNVFVLAVNVGCFEKLPNNEGVEITQTDVHNLIYFKMKTPSGGL